MNTILAADIILKIVVSMIPCSSMVEQVPVKDKVRGSSPLGGAASFFVPRKSLNITFDYLTSNQQFERLVL